MATPLIAAAVVIIVALAGYAGWLHYRLWRLKKERTNVSASVGVFEPHSSGRSAVSTEKSIYLLADALLDDKMTHTEGCIRICAVASMLEEHQQFRREYGVLFAVADATAHIPILEDWKMLDRKQQRDFDRERMSVENKYEEAVKEAALRLKAQYAPGSVKS